MMSFGASCNPTLHIILLIPIHVDVLPFFAIEQLIDAKLIRETNI